MLDPDRLLDSGQRAALMTLHLLVSNVFWPAAAGAEPYRGLALPAIEVLLARGRHSRTAGMSLERWLAGAYGLPEGAPLAPYGLLGDGGDPGDAWWMHADPVHLRVHGDQLILADATRIAPEAAEADSLVASLNTHFAPDGMAFVAPCPNRWYLRPAARPRLTTLPTSEIAGRSVAPFLPGGEDGPMWRRVFNEAQMVLHEHPCNLAREARGALTINSVWLWGAGQYRPLPPAYDWVWSDEPHAAGLAQASGAARRRLPEEFGSLPTGGVSNALVMATGLPTPAYGDIEAWRDAAARLDRTWIAPILARLRDDRRIAVMLYGLGPDMSIAAALSGSDLYRFWRRQRPLQAYAA